MVAIAATDLLKGVIAGIIIGIFFVLRQNRSGAIIDGRDDSGTRMLRFRRDGTFISKPALGSMLDTVQNGDRVIIDATGEFVDHDVKEVLAEFVGDAATRDVHVRLRGVDLSQVSTGGGHQLSDHRHARRNSPRLRRARLRGPCVPGLSRLRVQVILATLRGSPHGVRALQCQDLPPLVTPGPTPSPLLRGARSESGVSVV